MKRAIAASAAVLFLCVAFAGAAVRAPQSDEDPLDLKSIPIADWLDQGEHAQIPWDFRVSEPYLRVDQRLEVSYVVSFRGKELNKIGNTHELFFVSRVSSPDGEWLEEPSVSRPVDQKVPDRNQTEFSLRVCLSPGEYLLWVVLYHRESGKHNLAKRRIKVPELRADPLPAMYEGTPLVEFPEAGDSDQGFVKGRLHLPVHNKVPLQIQLVATLSPPQQWLSRPRALHAQTGVTAGALAALSQLTLAEGTLSIAGLDLVRQEVVYDEADVQGVDWPIFTKALKKAQTPAVSAKALQQSKNSGVFFKDFMNDRIEGRASDPMPMRILIVVSSSQLFERGSDLTPLQIEGDCRCRVYHLRFRLNNNDVFDEIEKIIKPLRPKTFNLVNSRDLRRAIADLVSELEKF
jgi:hypothetical protein